ncbi:conditioned medium-induced protein 4 [Halorientalis brevis]|uniref:Conditioned medium-induced protein 4 n=1 Tax=Halorientalis brevis TaxID=1126241 RepID=A0ABD6C9C7_9EURY|nr:conditioned medium-induced protein 4 [Halorientalis brevis]
MDEKTEELRDLFMDVTDEATVTESQSDERGSLAETDEGAIDDRLSAVVERMRDRYEFDTELPTEALTQVVRGFYDGDDDATIASTIDADPNTVFRARMDLHLLDDADTDFPFEFAALREHRDGDPDVPDLAESLDTDPATVARALRVVTTQEQIRRVSHRFQSEFEDAIPDAALSVHLTESAKEDGLDEAAEDIETNTQF